jgi:hypothetical protein
VYILSTHIFKGNYDASKYGQFPNVSYEESQEIIKRYLLKFTSRYKQSRDIYVHELLLDLLNSVAYMYDKTKSSYSTFIYLACRRKLNELRLQSKEIKKQEYQTKLKAYKSSVEDSQKSLILDCIEMLNPREKEIINAVFYDGKHIFKLKKTFGPTVFREYNLILKKLKKVYVELLNKEQ